VEVVSGMTSRDGSGDSRPGFRRLPS